MKKTTKPLLILTPGDPDGIGPEITLKALRKLKTRANFLLAGAARPFKKSALAIQRVSWEEVQSPSSLREFVRSFGTRLPLLEAPSKRLPGYQCGWSLQKAVDLLLEKQADALVTGPISKERLRRGGYPFNGHTDLLAHLARSSEPTMMLANAHLRVSLVTTHLAIRKVPSEVSRKKIRKTFLHTLQALQTQWKIKKPRIAILSLNPHAGENGLFGNEEERVIEPEILYLKKRYGSRARVTGPHPADTFFPKHMAAHSSERADAIIAMYHDQGLTPVKLIDFPRTVNITLGLPFIRTSVDHGVAFDIAGKNKADSSSMESAIQLAIALSKRS